MGQSQREHSLWRSLAVEYIASGPAEGPELHLADTKLVGRGQARVSKCGADPRGPPQQVLLHRPRCCCSQWRILLGVTCGCKITTAPY